MAIIAIMAIIDSIIIASSHHHHRFRASTERRKKWDEMWADQYRQGRLRTSRGTIRSGNVDMIFVQSPCEESKSESYAVQYRYRIHLVPAAAGHHDDADPWVRKAMDKHGEGRKSRQVKGSNAAAYRDARPIQMPHRASGGIGIRLEDTALQKQFTTSQCRIAECGVERWKGGKVEMQIMPRGGRPPSSVVRTSYSVFYSGFSRNITCTVRGGKWKMENRK